MFNETEDQLADKLIESYGPKEAQRQLALMAGYVDVPPTINEFLDEEYFAGKFLGSRLYPSWREVLNDVFPNPFNSPFLTVALTGSTRYGKTTCCLAGMLYDLVKLLYLKNPHDQFGLIETTLIVIAFINTTKNLSQSVLYAQFKEMIEMSPFFRDKRAGLNKKEFLPSKITPINGSTSDHYLGTGVVSAVLSELNFQKRLRDQAFNNFTTIQTRMQNTYGRGDHYISPGRLWMDSSKTDESGFMETKLAKLKEDPSALVIEKALWDVLGPAGKKEYSGEKFKVFVGSPNRDPFILSGPGASLNVPESLILDVPIEHKPEFDDNIHVALRDIAGKSTWSANKFFPNMAPVRASMRLRNPILKEVIDLDFRNSDRLIDMIDVSLLDRSAVYYFHIDLGLKFDRTGIAGTKCVGNTQVERVNSESGVLVPTEDFLYQTDIAMAIIPRPGEEVPIYKIKNFFTDLRTAGIKIGGISIDGHQSAGVIQDLLLLNFLAERISTDVDRSPYDSFKNAVLEGRWMGVEYALLQKEFSELLDTGKKIDHPLNNTRIGQVEKDRASKDVSDAVCGSHWNCKIKGTVGVMSFNAMEAYVNFATQKKELPRTMYDVLQDDFKRKQRRHGF